jgi:methionyl-tRNA formyltransferase
MPQFPLRTIFMGTPALAVPACRWLAENTDLTLVVTRPDKPVGRHRVMTAPPVKVLAQERGIPVWQPKTLRAITTEDLAKLQVDLIVVMAYGCMLPQSVLDAPRLGCVNLHASILPRHRGASPLHGAIDAGDAQTGVAIMKMVEQLDAGPVFLQEILDLPTNARLSWLEEAIAPVSVRALERYCANPGITPVTQDESLATYCHKLSTEQGHLDLTHSAVALDRRIRAYHPHPGTWLKVGEGRYHIPKAQVHPETLPLSPGETKVERRRLFLGTGMGTLEVLEIQAPGKKAMPTSAFLNGHACPPHFE